MSSSHKMNAPPYRELAIVIVTIDQEINGYKANEICNVKNRLHVNNV